jgi:hypothetical protein
MLMKIERDRVVDSTGGSFFPHENEGTSAASDYKQHRKESKGAIELEPRHHGGSRAGDRGPHFHHPHGGDPTPVGSPARRSAVYSFQPGRFETYLSRKASLSFFAGIRLLSNWRPPCLFRRHGESLPRQD